MILKAASHQPVSTWEARHPSIIRSPLPAPAPPPGCKLGEVNRIERKTGPQESRSPCPQNHTKLNSFSRVYWAGTNGPDLMAEGTLSLNYLDDPIWTLCTSLSVGWTSSNTFKDEHYSEREGEAEKWQRCIFCTRISQLWHRVNYWLQVVALCIIGCLIVSWPLTISYKWAYLLP